MEKKGFEARVKSADVMEDPVLALNGKFVVASYIYITTHFRHYISCFGNAFVF